MKLNKSQEAYLPMSETAYYTLLSLTEPRHGYGIMQHVEELTRQRLRIGAGTLYGSLSRMERDGLIVVVAEEQRRKTYEISPVGTEVLRLELDRLKELVANGLATKEALA